MADDGYNGWTNYETWAMALWIDNDAWSQNWALEIATEANGDRYDCAYALKDGMEETMPEVESVWADLLNAAWSEIDWYEIADAYLAQAAEEASS